MELWGPRSCLEYLASVLLPASFHWALPLILFLLCPGANAYTLSLEGSGRGRMLGGNHPETVWQYGHRQGSCRCSRIDPPPTPPEFPHAEGVGRGRGQFQRFLFHFLLNLVLVMLVLLLIKDLVPRHKLLRRWNMCACGYWSLAGPGLGN